MWVCVYVYLYVFVCVGGRWGRSPGGELYVRSFFTEFVESSAIRASFQDLFLFLAFLASTSRMGMAKSSFLFAATSC